jgi:hypothetical protein
MRSGISTERCPSSLCMSLCEALRAYPGASAMPPHAVIVFGLDPRWGFGNRQPLWLCIAAVSVILTVFMAGRERLPCASLRPKHRSFGAWLEWCGKVALLAGGSNPSRDRLLCNVNRSLSPQGHPSRRGFLTPPQPDPSMPSSPCSNRLIHEAIGTGPADTMTSGWSLSLWASWSGSMNR